MEEQRVEITNLTALNQNKQGKMSGRQPAHFLQAVSDSAVLKYYNPPTIIANRLGSIKYKHMQSTHPPYCAIVFHFQSNSVTMVS